MVLITKNDELKPRISTRKRMFLTILLGIIFLLIPVTFIFVDPISLVAEYKLRLENGSMLHELMLGEIEGPRIFVYLFNVTNAEEFMSGRDEKVKLEEVGPFVYQEYRTIEDLEINREPGIMRYTPKLRAAFVPEESIGRPEDIYFTVANIPLLTVTALVSKYPYFLRQMFSMYAASLHSRSFINISAYDYFWGRSDPLVTFGNTVAPGLIYFDSTGLLERLYDLDADYYTELGTTRSDKFSVKKVTRFQVKKQRKSHDKTQDSHTYADTYEGAAFPPNMSPEMPIHIYRHSICKTFQMQYIGTRRMNYGADSFVYNIHNTTFNDHELCNTKGFCPDGLKNMAPCYFDLPFALSKGHFLDADPRLLDRIEGLKPDRNIHDVEMVVDPKVGVTISGTISLQLNLFLADVGYHPETRRLKDTVLPITNVIIKQPHLLNETKIALNLMYIQGPYTLLVVEITCALLGLGLLAYSAKLLYWNWMATNRSIVLDNVLGEKLTKCNLPLLYK